MNRIAAAWARQPGAIKVLIVVVAVIAALNIAAALVGGEDETDPSPLISTGPGGFGAYASLLESYGFPVDGTPGGGERPLEGGEGTVVLLGENGLRDEDAAALRAFAEEGGTLLLDADEQGVIGSLLEDPPESSAPGPVDAAAVAGEGGVASVRADGSRVWSDAGEAEPLLAGAGGDLLLEAELGEGRAYLFADSSPLANRLLDQADNALLGLELAGEEREPVTFGLSRQALGAPSDEDGLEALPGEWVAALIGLVIAGLIAMAARARRLGPPEDPDRELMPSRGAYVDAVGSALARNGDRAAAAARLRESALTRLSRATMVDLGSDQERLEQWLRARGLDPDEAAALARGQAKTKEELMLVAGGLAKLSAERRGAQR